MTFRVFSFIILLLFICFRSNAQTPSGLVSYWPFDGNANDSIGNNHGEIFGDVRPTVGIDGKDSTALFFDGTGDYIKILSPQSSEMTIMFWMKPFDLWDDDRIVSGLDGTTNSFSLRYYSAGIQIWSPWRYMTSFIPDPSKWYFIAITINNNGSAKGYFNGVLHYEHTISYSGSTHWGIGRKFLHSYGNDFHGTLDEFSIYNRVLTSEEIQAAFIQYDPNSNPDFCNTLFWEEDKLGIGTQNPDMELTVDGNVHASGVKVDPEIPVPDYVFEPGYELRSLNELQKFIKENGHLPEIQPSEILQEEGLKLGEMDLKLLLKIEELTLYVIEQRRRIDSLLIIKKQEEGEQLKLKLLARRIEELENLLEIK